MVEAISASSGVNNLFSKRISTPDSVAGNLKGKPSKCSCNRLYTSELITYTHIPKVSYSLYQSILEYTNPDITRSNIQRCTVLVYSKRSVSRSRNRRVASAGVRISQSECSFILSRPRFSPPPSRCTLPGITCTDSENASKRVLAHKTTPSWPGVHHSHTWMRAGTRKYSF